MINKSKTTGNYYVVVGVIFTWHYSLNESTMKYNPTLNPRFPFSVESYFDVGI